MTDRIQPYRDWIAAQLQQCDAMTPGPWRWRQEFATRCRIEQDTPPGTIGLNIGYAATTMIEMGVGAESTIANAAGIAAAGIAAARNQWRALLLGYDDLLAEYQRVMELEHNCHDTKLCAFYHEIVLQPIFRRLSEAGYTETADAS